MFSYNEFKASATRSMAKPIQAPPPPPSNPPRPAPYIAPPPVQPKPPGNLFADELEHSSLERLACFFF